MRATFIIFFYIALAVTSLAAPKQIDVNEEVDQQFTYDGIDVSSYQRDIDWTATARDKNIKFVYVKATEGATYRSPHYVRNIDNARKQGIKVGSYHFLRTTSTMDQQFQNFIATVNRADQDLIPLIDVEAPGRWTSQQIADSVEYFANLLEKHYGCRPMIYTSSSFFNAHLQRFAHYPLFIARYSTTEPSLKAGAKWTLWQFSERGRVAGIDHTVDLCRFNEGCDIKDILIKANKIDARHRRVTDEVSKGAVPPRPTKLQQEAEKKLSKKEREQLERQRKQQQEAEEKAAKKAAKEREKQEKKLEEQRKKEAHEQAERQADSLKHAKQQAEKLRKQQQKQAAAQSKQTSTTTQKTNSARSSATSTKSKQTTTPVATGFVDNTAARAAAAKVEADKKAAEAASSTTTAKTAASATSASTASKTTATSAAKQATSQSSTATQAATTTSKKATASKTSRADSVKRAKAVADSLAKVRTDSIKQARAAKQSTTVTQTQSSATQKARKTNKSSADNDDDAAVYSTRSRKKTN